MSKSVFRYPGSKSKLSSWIIEHMADHSVYVEPFGGSAAVLVNKNPSGVEVFNDRDGDIVQFFEVLRDSPDELIAWLRDTPHSRELYDKYSHEFHDGHRPTDPVARAGRFWYVRQTAFAAKYASTGGYNGSKKRNIADTTASKRERLRGFSERFDPVQIESLDFEPLIDRYGGENTLLYCDPPYVDEGDALYSGDDFDHERFVSSLRNTESDWIVSYTDPPAGLLELAECVVAQDQRVSMTAGQSQDRSNTEHLVMNYDPGTTPLFNSACQTTYTDF